MNENVYILQNNVWDNTAWTGIVVYKIESFPSPVLKETLGHILGISEQFQTSLEFMMHSSDDNNSIETSIICRKIGNSPRQIEEEMDRFSEIMSDRLKYAGFQIVNIPSHDVQKYETKIKNQKKTLLCVPGENRRKVDFCYTPGGYDAIDKIDFHYILSILSKCKNVGMNMHITPTLLSKNEENIIVENLNWLSQLNPNMDVQNAMRAFHSFYKMNQEQMYFLTLTINGNENDMLPIISEMQKCGFAFMVIPSDAFLKNSYLVFGQNFISNFAIVNGHIIKNGVIIPAGCERLNFLTNPEGIEQLLSDLKNPEECKGLIVNQIDTSIGNMPKELLGNEGIEIGSSVGKKEKATLPLNQLSKHMVIGGMPGSGKTTFLFQILSELSRNNIPFLAIEPTKSEYRELLDAIPNLKIMTPGKTNLCPIMFNPFLPPKGVSLEQFLPSLEAAFQMAFSLTTPLDVIFPEVLRNCYADFGWRNDSTSEDSDVTVFGIHEFICAFRKEINQSAYDQESKQNLLSGGVYRFMSLINSNPYLFNTNKSLSIEDLLKGYTLIEFDAIDNKEQKSLILSLLMLQIKLVIRNGQKKDSKLKNVIIIDEAHVLLGQEHAILKRNEANPAGKIREYLLNMVKENRAYGTGMIFADQSLSLMKDFVDNSNIKIAMHLETKEDRTLLRDNLNLSNEICKNIANLQLGQYYLSYEESGAPILMQAPNTRKNLSLRDDIDDEELKRRVRIIYSKPFTSCPCKKECNLEIRNEAEFLARKIFNKISGQLKNKESVEKYKKMYLKDAIYQMAEDSDNPQKLAKCTRIMVERMMDLKLG